MKSLATIICLILSLTSFAQKTSTKKYYRHLRYNHVSPFIELAGTYPINKATAQATSHYVFTYNQDNQIVEILNYHYHSEKKHPLASIGVYRLAIAYENGKEIRIFFDKKGRRVTNDREVFKEVFTLEKKGFKNKLQFFDLEDKPCESNWKIAEYQWEKKRKAIIERRFNLKNEPVDVSPYFSFGITKIVLDKKGFPKAHYNLNDELKVTNNSVGVASYQDLYDEKGNHEWYSYHDQNDQLTLNQWKFAKGKKTYNEIGNQIGLEHYDAQGKKMRSRVVHSNTAIRLSDAPTKEDSTEIIKQSLGYLIALQELNPELMNQVMNDSLNKVTIGYDRGTKLEYARATTKKRMIENAKSWNKGNNMFPTTPKQEVKILDIYNRMASVKLISDNWVEYLHLIKLDGEWEIINLIWQHKDVNWYPKESLKKKKAL